MILATFVKENGGADILTQPPDTGFNRLIWAVPFAVGIFGAAAAGVAAVKWSRRSAEDGAAGGAGGGPVPGEARRGTA